MFTFIKIAYHQALHGRNVEKIGRRPVIGHHVPPQSEDDDLLNPWETELSRIATNRGEQAVPIKHYKGKLPRPEIPARPENEISGRQGTLTDLKIWWGNASAAKPGEIDIKSFAPAPRRHQTRWWQ